jgi:hypothetical protein
MLGMGLATVFGLLVLVLEVYWDQWRWRARRIPASDE